jgi:hypothetical protein
MYFRSLAQVRHLPMQSGTTLEMPLAAFSGITVLMRPPTEEEVGAKFHENDAVFVVTCERGASARVEAMFASLATGVLLTGWVKAERWENAVQEDGRLKHPTVAQRYLPPPMRDYLTSVQTTIAEARDRLASVVRWRYDIPGHLLRFAHGKDDWSLDGQQWHPMPFGDVNASVEGYPFFNPSERTGGILAELTKREEPVGHELFREGWANRVSNPRSSLLMGIAALEVGFKECVADLVPTAAWLVENAPTPPVVAMLTDYLPSLPARLKINDQVIAPPKPILDLLKKGVLLRNKVTHTGAEPPSRDSLEGILQAVQDVLWLLDYYRGHGWANQRMSYETRQALFPEPTDTKPG